jgi:hypothetical protein
MPKLTLDQAAISVFLIALGQLGVAIGQHNASAAAGAFTALVASCLPALIPAIRKNFTPAAVAAAVSAFTTFLTVVLPAVIPAVGKWFTSPDVVVPPVEPVVPVEPAPVSPPDKPPAVPPVPTK